MPARAGLPSGRAIVAVAACLAALALGAPVVAADAQPRRFSFMPNQLAANAWYRPGPPATVINSHLDDSFGRPELWPRLRGHLKRLGGSFSCGAAEVGWLSARAGLLPLLRAEAIPLAVELPGFTQGIDGAELAEAELNGARLRSGESLFAKVFLLERPAGRSDPDGRGWFVTRDGQPLVPDEILFDERIPNLLPTFDPARLVATEGTWAQRTWAQRPWAQRKAAARQPNGYLAADLPFDQRLAALMDDYVRYLRVAQAKWGRRMPAISLHWNVTAGWEWRDEAGLDASHAGDPAWPARPEDFWAAALARPHYNSVRYLNDLLDRLAAAGFAPHTVYMDVDWTYSVPYVTEVLRRHAADLRARGVRMGINLVEASLDERDELTFAAHTLTRRTVADGSPNVLYENTLLAIAQLLRDRGLDGPEVIWRVGSWSRRPAEIGEQVAEETAGSLAHTANAIAETRR